MTEKRNTLLMSWRMVRVGWHLVSGCTQIAVFFGRSSPEQKQGGTFSKAGNFAGNFLYRKTQTLILCGFTTCF